MIYYLTGTGNSGTGRYLTFNVSGLGLHLSPDTAYYTEIAPLTGSGLKMRQDKALDAIRAMHEKQKSGAAIEQAMSTQAEIDTLQGMDPKAARGAAGLNGP